MGREGLKKRKEDCLGRGHSESRGRREEAPGREPGFRVSSHRLKSSSERKDISGFGVGHLNLTLRAGKQKSRPQTDSILRANWESSGVQELWDQLSNVFLVNLSCGGDGEETQSPLLNRGVDG